MLLRIRKHPDPILRAPTKKILKVNAAIESLAHSMMKVMLDNSGIGLAAPQVGQSIKLIVINTVGELPEGEEFKDDTGFNGTLINPVIEKTEGSISIKEGCLSFPGLEVEVSRAASVTVAYTDIYGRNTVSTFKGLTAIVVQHELDHLEEKLLIDYE